MNIPDSLVHEIRQGRVVLFLGAGASWGAKNPAGVNPPLGDGLRNRISDRFLGGKFKNQSLAFVSDLAVSESDLFTVQDFVAQEFADLVPTDFHKLLAGFKWRGLFTVNYDRLVETIYERSRNRVQELVTIVSDLERVDERLRSPDQLALFKLHGSITRTHDPNLPLILTVEQYATHQEGRRFLFRTFEQWAFEYPVVFVGHSLQDSDIRAALLQISKDLQIRPRHYLIKPDATEEESRLWETKKITTLVGTFEEFLRKLDRLIPQAMRPLLKRANFDHPVKARFAVNEEISPTLEDFFNQDVEYVHPSMPIGEGKPRDFYRGFNLEWYPIERGLDVRRRLTDTILNDVIIRAEEDRPAVAELYAIKAEAGAGKSVFLRRLAWDAAAQANALILYVREHSSPRYEALHELYRVVQQRIFLFCDDAADNTGALTALVSRARKERLPLTIITAERLNAWYMSCQSLNEYLSEAFVLRYLSRSEIEELVRLLDMHDSLGPNLRNKNFEERVEQFHEEAGRQLLVALHEATLGAPYEEILLDEFNEIQPQAARSLYLTVCVLNRMRVPVRAGLVARVHQIAFEDFRERFFAPLDHVVKVRLNSATGDFFYTARHPEIAQIVFERVLKHPADRYNEYVRILKELNPSYSSDRDSFRGMIRAKSLHDLFPDYQNVRSIFEFAEQVSPKDAYLFQQRANYERIRPDGNYVEAHKLLRHARELDPKDTSITHTLAELARTEAENSEHPLERERFRAESRKLLRPLVADPLAGRYARITSVKLALDALRDVLANEQASDRAIDDGVRAVEQPLQRWLQEHPDDQFLLSAEADLGQMLRDHDRSVVALQRGFAANPRDPYITSRLSRVLEQRGDLDGAREVLSAALEANRGDKQLNYRYAMVLRKIGIADRGTLMHHFRRAFTEGDSNHEARFWYARYAFESADAKEREESRQLFKLLREAAMAHEARIDIRDRILHNDRPAAFTGSIIRHEAVHGFVDRDGVGDWIFYHRNNVDDVEWDKLRNRQRVAFSIGFSYAGVRALEVQVI